MLYKQAGSKYYWCKFQWNGATIRRPTKATDKKTARKVESKIRSELALENYGILQPKARPTLSEFLKKSFLPFTETRFKEFPKTAIYYRQGVARLVSSQLATLRLDEITNQHAAQFEAQHSRYSASTINQALRTLRRAMRLAEEWGELIRAPKITLAKGERQRERIVTEEEFNRYIMACRQPWRDAAILIYCLGLRPSEVYTLRWKNISLTETGFLQIMQGKSKAARRMLPLLVPMVQTVLQSRNREQGFPKEGWVFPTESKSGHLEQGSVKNQHEAAFAAIEKAAKEECKKAGRAESEAKILRPFPPYCLRHTALTNLAPQCDTFTLKTIAGHSQISMTARYVHPQGEVIGEAFEKIAERQKVVIEAGHSASSEESAENSERAANS